MQISGEIWTGMNENVRNVSEKQESMRPNSVNSKILKNNEVVDNLCN